MPSSWLMPRNRLAHAYPIFHDPPGHAPLWPNADRTKVAYELHILQGCGPVGHGQKTGILIQKSANINDGKLNCCTHQGSPTRHPLTEEGPESVDLQQKAALVRVYPYGPFSRVPRTVLCRLGVCEHSCILRAILTTHPCTVKPEALINKPLCHLRRSTLMWHGCIRPPLYAPSCLCERTE